MIAWLAACATDRVPVAEAPPPALRRADTVAFLALGDTGKGSPAQERVAAGAAATCARRGCDFLVLLGDNLYPIGMESADDPRMQSWIAEMYAPAGVPIYLVLGNHDYGRGRDRHRAEWQVRWASAHEGTPPVVLPANAWSMDAGPARIVALDTNAIFQFGEGFQSRWLADRLGATSSPWRVVFGHHPFRSDGPHGNAGEYDDSRGLPWVAGRSLRKLFDDRLCGSADLYLAAHDHSRQLLERCGVTLVVSGGGAATTPIVDRGNRPRFASDRPGAAWISLGPTDGTVVFVDADGAEEAEFSIGPPGARTRR